MIRLRRDNNGVRMTGGQQEKQMPNRGGMPPVKAMMLKGEGWGDPVGRGNLR